MQSGIKIVQQTASKIPFFSSIYQYMYIIMYAIFFLYLGIVIPHLGQDMAFKKHLSLSYSICKDSVQL